MGNSTRLTVLLPLAEYRYWEQVATGQGRSVGRHIRVYMQQLLDEHGNRTGAARQIPAAAPPTCPVQVTLPEPLAQRLALTAERLGYSQRAALVRAMLAQESDPWARLAHSLGFRDGPACQQAILRGELVLVALPATALPATAAALSMVLTTAPQTPDQEERQTLGQLRQALLGALSVARQSQRQPQIKSRARRPADAATRRLEWQPFTPMPAPPLQLPGAPRDYAGKFAGLLCALRAAQEATASPDVRVTRPEVLGDTAEEVLQSLSLWAETGCGLALDREAASREHTATYTARALLLAALNAAPGHAPEWYFQVTSPSDLGTCYTDLQASLSLLAARQVRLLVAQPQPGSIAFATLLAELP